MATPVMRTPAEAATMIGGLTENWLRDQARLRKVPHHRPGRKIMFTDEDIAEIVRLTAVAAGAGATPAKAPGGRRSSGNKPPVAQLLESRPPRKRPAA
jgi:hypothetical protein